MIPSHGCGDNFSIEHALDCRFGGLVGRESHHNEVRDAISDLASLIWGDVVREPVVCEYSDSSDGARVVEECGYLSLRHSSDTDTRSYRNHNGGSQFCRT